MKTNIIMTRRMGQFEVKQRTQDGYFNATELLQHWNEANGMQKQMGHFTGLESTKALINEIETDNGITLSKKGVADIKKGGKNQGTWMQSYLFIDFAMWLNPKFKLQVIKFVHDQLMEYRNESGDLTKELNSSVQRFEGINYPQLAKGLNYVTYGRHEKGIRNAGTEEQTKSIVDLQKKLAFACDMGYINSFDQLLEEMRRLWSLKK